MQCKFGHLGYRRCVAELPGNPCKQCEQSVIDAIVSAPLIEDNMIECPNVGCGTLVASNEPHVHYIACQYGPCACLEARIGCAFTGSPLELLVHFSADHSFRVYRFKYGMPAWYLLRVPVKPPGYILTGYGDEDGAVFGLTVTTLGPITVVSCVCIRSAACLWPRYTVQLMSIGPPAPAGSTDFSTDIVSAVIEPTSTATPGAVALHQLTSFLAVPPRYPRDVGPYRQLNVSVCINKKIIS